MTDLEIQKIIVDYPPLEMGEIDKLFTIDIPTVELTDILFKHNIQYYIGFINKYNNFFTIDEGLSFCYKALGRAVLTYKPSGGRNFIGWVTYYLKSIFRYEASKVQKVRDNESSIDADIGNEFTLADILSAPTEDDTIGDLEEYLRHLPKALSTLSPRNQEYFDLYYFKGLNLRQISDKFNVSKQCIHITLQRNFKNLKRELEREMLIEQQKFDGTYVENVKTCTKCGEVKPLEAFGKKVTGHGGLNSRCKKCINKKAKEYKKVK